jgi:hypothetical protein
VSSSAVPGSAERADGGYAPLVRDAGLAGVMPRAAYTDLSALALGALLTAVRATHLNLSIIWVACPSAGHKI